MQLNASEAKSDAAGDVGSRKNIDMLRNRKVIQEMRNIADNEAKVKFELKVGLLISCHARHFFIYFWKEKNASVIFFFFIGVPHGPTNLSR